MNRRPSPQAAWPASFLARVGRPVLPLLLLLLLLIPISTSPVEFSAASTAAVPAAAGLPFPSYVYTVISGPASYDVMLNAAGKERRLARVGTAGVGFGEVAARISPDSQHVAIRVAGDANGGSSLRILEIQSSRAITVTLSRSGEIGLGSLAWAPNGHMLAYTVAAPERADADSGAGALWVVGADARGAHRIGGTGTARLLGWAPDSQGLYYTRNSGDDNSPLDLWYQPLTGDAVPVLRSSPGALQYSMFAVAPVTVTAALTPTLPGAAPAAPGSGTPGGARIAALATGNLATLPVSTTVPANVPRSRPAPRPAPAGTPGVIAGDGLGNYQALPDLGEDYTVFAWNPAGTHLLFSGGKSHTAWFADVNAGKRWRLSAALDGLAPIAWSADSRYVVLADATGPANMLVTLDTATGAVVRTRYVGSPPKAGAAVKDLPMPYISQLWHTGVGFDGNWACGPTSIDMVLAYYGRLAPWPFPSGLAKSSPQDRLSAHMAGAEASKLDLMDGHLYGQYVTTAFTYNGHTFNAPGTDPAGHRVQGLYGAIVGNTSLAQWDDMISVLGLYDIQTDYIPVTWSAITAQISKGYPVVLGTTLTPSGHILVARGYTANGYLLVNDPYGNRFGPYGYGEADGGDAAYAWKKIPAKLAMVTRGTITPPATPTPTASATPAPGTPAPATATPTISPTPVPFAHGVNP